MEEFNCLRNLFTSDGKREHENKKNVLVEQQQGYSCCKTVCRSETGAQSVDCFLCPCPHFCSQKNKIASAGGENCAGGDSSTEMLGLF